MQLTPRSRFLGRGFTLVELMITLTVLGILLALSVPSFNGWIRNTRVRTVADTLQNGLRLAQAEAVRRNRTVEFFLTNAEPGVSAVSVAGGRNWGIRTLPLFTGDPAEFVRGAALSDVAAMVTIAGPQALCINAAGQQIEIISLGCLIDPAAPTARYDLTITGGDRPLRVTSSIGGRVRMCDPAKTLSATNPDGC